MNTRTIVRVLLAFFSFSTCYSQVAKDEKIVSWIEGYLYDTKHFIETVQATNVVTVKVLDGSFKRKVIKEQRVDEREEIEKLIDLVLTDIFESAKDVNEFDDHSNHISSEIMAASPTPELEVCWEIVGREAFIRVAGRELSCWIRSYRKKEKDKFIERVHCSDELKDKILKLLQPDCGHNSGSSAASIVTP